MWKRDGMPVCPCVCIKVSFHTATHTHISNLTHLFLTLQPHQIAFHHIHSSIDEADSSRTTEQIEPGCADVSILTCTDFLLLVGKMNNALQSTEYACGKSGLWHSEHRYAL